MAEAIGVASGVVALATFACQSSKSLYEILDSFKSVKRTVRDLDWARLQYMGGGIANLKATLAGYKVTISIALGGATL